MKSQRLPLSIGSRAWWPALCALSVLAFAGCSKSATTTADAPSAPAAPKATASPTKAWPQDKSDIKPDPTAIFGVLPNGFRYVIVPNKEPPGRMSLRLRVNAGSFMETDQQRGLAHFLEHMAFNGGKHFPPGEMVGFFQHLGLAFGADTNANTSYDRTLYMLELPDVADKTVRDCLQLFQDDADGLLLLQTEVDRERGVILSEKRDRDNVGYRTGVAEMDFAFPNTLFSLRQPIGLENIIRESGRDRFADFYNKWYTPGRMTLVAVGDIKPDDLLPLIKEYFGAIKPRTESPDPDLGKFGSPGFQATFHREAEAPAITLDLGTIAPFDLGPDSVAREAAELKLEAANYIVSRRFERIARQPNAPITGASASSGAYFDAVEASQIEAECQPGQWQAALNVAEQELRRALDYGFTAAEVAEARASLVNDFEQSAKQASTRKSGAIASTVASSLDENQVFTSPAQDLELAKPVLAALTPEQCQTALKEAWGRSGRRLFVSGNLDLTDAAVAAAYNQSAATKIDKPTDNAAAAFAYASTGAPGQIVESKEVADLGITQLRFANNVRVNLKATDFEKDKIHILVQFGGGRLDLPADKPALALAADHVFTEGGLGKHSADELEQILAGKTVGAAFSTGLDFFALGGVTSPGDFRLELELLKAYITDPGYRPEALALARRMMPMLFTSLRQNVEAVLENEVPRFLASDDYRFGFPSQAQAEALTMDDLRAWLNPILKDSYLEISIVGDFDPAAMKTALAATFGTLPARADKRPDYSAVQNVKFPVAAEGTVKTFTVPSAIPKAEAFICWPTCDQSDIQRVRILSVVAEVFTDRLRVQVRQKLGAAYSPDVGNSSSDTFPGYGFAEALITVDPKLTAELADLARTMGDELAKNGVTQDEFDRAITPVRKSIVEYRRQNSYWLGRVLAGSQAFPQRAERARTLATAYDAITPEQVSAAAKEFFGAEHAVRVLVVPEAPAATATAQPASAAASGSSSP